MTKAELIRTIAKKNGIPGEETKYFFELLLQKAASILKKGEAVKLEGVGYLQLREGMMRNLSGKPEVGYSGRPGKTNFFDVMVFYALQGQSSGTEEKLIFNIPTQQPEEFNELDSYFSISIGKPVIPLEGEKDSEYNIPPFGGNMKKIIEDKVEKIIEQSEITERFQKINPVREKLKPARILSMMIQEPEVQPAKTNLKRNRSSIM
jgi:Bacterial DNA-binding protein